MIFKRHPLANPWAPDGFGQFIEYFPVTEWQPPRPSDDLTRDFQAMWQSADRSPLPNGLAMVLTPGLFAEWLPACFRAARLAFESDGLRVLKTRARTALGVRDQARALAKQTLSWLRSGERFIWCAHSKGGLDALWALEHVTGLRERCAAIVLVQPPVRHSWLAQKWLYQARTVPERLKAFVLTRSVVRGGLQDISLARDPEVTVWLEEFSPSVPTVNIVSWSIRPTSWVDSYHKALAELRPGHAHDGQIYLCDQRLPTTPIVCLPELDHAQPVLGGRGFDTARFWWTAAECAWQHAQRVGKH